MFNGSSMKRLTLSKTDFEILYKDYLTKLSDDEFDVIYFKTGSDKLKENEIPEFGAYYIYMSDNDFRSWYRAYNIPQSKIILKSTENDYEIDLILLHNLWIKKKIEIDEMIVNYYCFKSPYSNKWMAKAYLETLTVNYIHPSK